MTFYPRVLREPDTLDLVVRSNLNLSLFGADELKLAAGELQGSPRIVAELRDMLWRGHPNCLVCIPRQQVGPNCNQWQEYQRPTYVHLCGNQVFGSSFLFAPRDAPWIDTASYWQRVQQLWSGQRVLIITEPGYDLQPADFKNARSADVIEAPAREMSDDVLDAVENKIGEPDYMVLLRLGTAGAVLSWRLARKRVRSHHMGRFNRRAFNSAAA